MKYMKYLPLLFLSASAFAWPTCSGRWVSMPKGTTGGVIYNAGDLVFQCQSDPSPISLTSSSASTATSSATAAQNQHQNQAQRQNQSQGQTANGGNATGGNSNSTAYGGNSTANGGNAQGGTATANNNGGNNSNNSVSNTSVQRNTPFAYAPEAIPSAPCVKGYSGGATGAAFGASFGGGKIDNECSIRETARAFALGGSRVAYCKVLITAKSAKRANVTLDDCLGPIQPLPEPLPITIEIADSVPPIVIIPPYLILQQPPVILPVLVKQPRPKPVHKKIKAKHCKEWITISQATPKVNNVTPRITKVKLRYDLSSFTFVAYTSVQNIKESFIGSFAEALQNVAQITRRGLRQGAVSYKHFSARLA